MLQKFTIALLSIILSSCVIKNYETAPPAKSEPSGTIQWKDGSQTKIKPPVIENRP